MDFHWTLAGLAAESSHVQWTPTDFRRTVRWVHRKWQGPTKVRRNLLDKQWECKVLHGGLSDAHIFLPDSGHSSGFQCHSSGIYQPKFHSCHRILIFQSFHQNSPWNWLERNGTGIQWPEWKLKIAKYGKFCNFRNVRKKRSVKTHSEITKFLDNYIHIVLNSYANFCSDFNLKF